MTRSVRAMCVTFATFAVLSIAPAVAHATPVLFSNFGVAQSYDTSAGNPVGNDFFGGIEWQAETFTSAATAHVGVIRLALSDADGSKDPITVALRADAGDTPGAILESFTIPGGTAGSLGINNSVFTLTSVLTPLLTVGTRYWITVAAPGTSSYVWNWNDTGENADHGISFDGGASWFVAPSGFFTPGAFEVDDPSVNPVPEPSTLFLIATAGGVLVRRRRGMRCARLVHMGHDAR